MGFLVFFFLGGSGEGKSKYFPSFLLNMLGPFSFFPSLKWQEQILDEVVRSAHLKTTVNIIGIFNE
jgi:hypothetical protein